ncbi:type II secretion system protein GspJ [Yersinia enterocolitica]|uniref:type II secretion system protein GspJ n=1 Tax=Yersinia enterocolitica TaxID=630 RepID=UPI002FC330A2
MDIKQPKVLKILDGVTAFRIHIYHKNRWLNEWTDTNFLPEAVELIIEMENIDKFDCLPGYYRYQHRKSCH